MQFSPEDNQPIRYMERTRTYYAALGYTTAYRWASFADVPFTRLAQPLGTCRIALVTTAAPYEAAHGDQSPAAPYNGRAKFFTPYSLPIDPAPDLRISHVAYDRQHTTAGDPRSYLPLPALRAAATVGRIAAVTAHVHGAPTNRSHRVTLGIDAPDLLRRCREDGADAVVLVPNCPVCHQTAALVARQLEAAGLPTVIMGAAKDIVEHCGVPRLCFSDFPLGNAAGKPHDPASQAATLDLALTLLERAFAPRTTVQSSQRWSDDPDWHLDYCNVTRIPPERLAELRAAFDREKAHARA